MIIPYSSDGHCHCYEEEEEEEEDECEVIDTNDSQPTETVAVHAILIAGGTTENVRRCAGIHTIAGFQ